MLENQHPPSYRAFAGILVVRLRNLGSTLRFNHNQGPHLFAFWGCVCILYGQGIVSWESDQ